MKLGLLSEKIVKHRDPEDKETETGEKCMMFKYRTFQSPLLYLSHRTYSLFSHSSSDICQMSSGLVS